MALKKIILNGTEIELPSGGGGGEIEPIPSDDFFSGISRFYVYSRTTNILLFTGLMVNRTWADLCDQHPSFKDAVNMQFPSFNGDQIYNEDETVVLLSDRIEAKRYIC